MPYIRRHFLDKAIVWLVGQGHPSEKWWSSSIGMIIATQYMGKITNGNQTTNQMYIQIISFCLPRELSPKLPPLWLINSPFLLVNPWFFGCLNYHRSPFTTRAALGAAPVWSCARWRPRLPHQSTPSPWPSCCSAGPKKHHKGTEWEPGIQFFKTFS